MNKERLLRNAVLAGVLALGGLGAKASTPEEANSATVRTYTCNTTEQTFPLTKGEIGVIKASGAVVLADVRVDDIKYYDSLGDTSTKIVLKSTDNTNKTWVTNNDNGGTLVVEPCGASFATTERAAGKWGRNYEKNTGYGNTLKSVQEQWYVK